MNKKLQELILYIAHKSHDDPAFSSTKLNKILFMADFFAYGLWGESLTGTTYVRRQYGPTPKEMPIIQNELTKAGRAEIQEKEYFGHVQKRLIPLANPNLSLFSPAQIQLVHDVLRECRQFSATQLSEWTHTLPPWLDADDGEEIPYETIYVFKKMPVGHSEMAWAEQEIEELLAQGEDD